MNLAVPFDQRVTCTVLEAVAFTGLSRSFIFEKLADKTLDSTTIGRRRLIKVQSLLAMVLPKPVEQQHAA